MEDKYKCDKPTMADYIWCAKCIGKFLLYVLSALAAAYVGFFGA